MAKHTVVLTDEEYTEIMFYLESAKDVLLTMRKTHKRNNIEFMIDQALKRLTEEDDDIKQRLRNLETIVRGLND